MPFAFTFGGRNTLLCKIKKLLKVLYIFASPSIMTKTTYSSLILHLTHSLSLNHNISKKYFL